ncbi:hypothetical protein A3F59_02605 [Candidatus Roizmanbacteria bacterium RIFCSPHIGHO2_12_FULL_38_13]|nr:MAG: hypothetical protein A3F59_02605 [Candidatus Roizmanbacteria bacterium RIFCSPHIGHO2_12_FULL_38_13]
MMKILLKIAPIIIILVAIGFSIALAASVDEDFNGSGYTDETSLVGLNGGTCWGQAWQDGADVDDWSIESTGCRTANCANADTGSADIIDDREFSAGITNASTTVYMKRSDTNDNGFIRFAKTDNTTIITIFYERNGLGSDILLNNSVDIGGWVVDQWHSIELEWGDTGGGGTCAANEVRARMGGDTWSACTAFMNTQTGAVEQVEVDWKADGGGTMGIDELVIIDADGGSCAVAAVATPANPLWRFISDF